MSSKTRSFIALGSVVLVAGAANAWFRSRPAGGSSADDKKAKQQQQQQQQGEASAHPCAQPFTLRDVALLPDNPDELQITLYQYSYHPASVQLRSYMELHKLPYKAVEVNPLTKKQLPYPPDECRDKPIPLLILNGRELAVAVHAIMLLELYRNRANPLQPSTQESALTGDLMYHIDQNLVQLVQANRYATLRSASKSVRPLRRADNLSLSERVLAPPLAALSLWWQWRTARRLMRRIHGDDLRQALVREVNAYADLLGDQRQFFGGQKPGLVDVHLYGALRSVEAEETGQFALAHAPPRFAAWYGRMQQLTSSSNS